MIDILVADDHPIVRKGLKELLNKEVDLHVKDEASTGTEVLEKINRGRYDVILLDITMPGRNGLEIIREIKTRKIKTAVLVLSMYPEAEYAIRAIRAGASGYVNKKNAITDVVEAIRQVAGGGKYINETVGKELAMAIQGRNGTVPHKNLSDREFEVMCLIGSGKSLSEIAEELYLSLSTISTYRTRILQKLRLTNNAQIVHYVVTNDLLPQ